MAIFSLSHECHLPRFWETWYILDCKSPKLLTTPSFPDSNQLPPLLPSADSFYLSSSGFLLLVPYFYSWAGHFPQEVFTQRKTLFPRKLVPFEDILADPPWSSCCPSTMLLISWELRMYPVTKVIAPRCITRWHSIFNSLKKVVKTAHICNKTLPHDK